MSEPTFMMIWIAGAVFLLCLAFLLVVIQPWKAFTGATLAALSILAYMIDDESKRLRSEISPPKYVDVDYMIEIHPELAPLAERMLSDGAVTESEFRTLRKKANSLDAAATKKQALASIKTQIADATNDGEAGSVGSVR